LMFPVTMFCAGRAKKKVVLPPLAEVLQLQAGELAWDLWRT
jgi:hypothetical protein